MPSTVVLAATALIVAMQAICTLKLLSKLRLSCLFSVCSPGSLLPCHRKEAESAADSPQLREIRRETAKLLAFRRIRLAQTASYGLWVAACVLGIPMVMESLSDDSILAGANLFSRTVQLIVLTVVSLFPRVMNLAFVPNITHTILMACMCLMALQTTHDCMRATYVEMMSMPALIISGIGTNLGIVCATNSLLTLSQIRSSVRVEEDLVQTQMIHGQLLMLVIRILICYCADASVKWVTKADVEARYELRQQSAVLALLGMTCDAVVDLDSDLRFEEHFPKFAGMLMHGPGRTLQGQGLLDFVPDQDDRARVEAEFHRDAVEEGERQPPPGMTAVSLRDSIGNHVKTTLLHVPYASINGSIRHLVGVREDSDGFSTAMDESTQVAPEAVLRPDLRDKLMELSSSSNSVPHAKGSRVVSNGSVSSRSSRSSASSGQAHNDDANFERSAEVFFYTNVPVRWMSQNFRSDLGILPAPSGGEEDRYELGNKTADGGNKLLAAMMDVVEKQRKRYKSGHFVKCLGEFDFTAPPDIEQGPGAQLELHEGATRRKVWMNFYLPLREDEDGFPFAAIAISKTTQVSSGGGGGRGTAGGRGGGGRGGGGAAAEVGQLLKGTASSSIPERLPARAGGRGVAVGVAL